MTKYVAFYKNGYYYVANVETMVVSCYDAERIKSIDELCQQYEYLRNLKVSPNGGVWFIG